MRGVENPMDNLLHITEAIEAEDGYKLQDSTIYLYSPVRRPLVRRRAEDRRPYIVRDVVKEILLYKKTYTQQKNSPCNLRMCSKAWADIQGIIGTSGVMELCKMYSIFERVKENSYIKYFTEKENTRNRKDTSRVEWKPIKNISQIRREDIYGEDFYEFTDEIDRTVSLLRSFCGRGIISSFIKTKRERIEREEKEKIEKEKNTYEIERHGNKEDDCEKNDYRISAYEDNGSGNYDCDNDSCEKYNYEYDNCGISAYANDYGKNDSCEKNNCEDASAGVASPGIIQYEMRIRTAVRIVYSMVRKVFSHVIPSEGMARIKRKIRWFLINSRNKMEKADLYSELKTNFKGKIGNRSPLLYKQYMIRTIDFIFMQYIPHILAIHIVGTGNTEDTVRFFFREGYAEREREFREAYIEEYFERVKPEEKETSNEIVKIALIPKKNTFRTVFKKEYPKESASLSIMLEKMVCSILTREAAERVEWEVKKRNTGEREPRTRLYNSIFRMDDVLLKIDQFKKEYRKYFLSGRPLYILILDIKNCFDNMSLDVINRTGLLKRLVGKKEYEVFNWKDRTADGLVIHRRIVVYPDEWIDKGSLIVNGLPRNGYRIFKSDHTFREEEIERILDRNINRSILEYKEEKYRRIKGINQGSRFASHICAYYMGLVDEEIYRDLDSTHVIRYVDDSMILSWSTEELTRIVERIEGVKDKYGVSLNMSKCRLFTTEKERDGKIFLSSIPATCPDNFKWCGFKFKTETLSTVMGWTVKRDTPGICRLKSVKKWMNYNIAVNNRKDLFTVDNPARKKNLRLFIRCQVEKTLSILQNPANRQLEDGIIRYLLLIITRILRKNNAFTQTEIRTAFNTAVYVYKSKNMNR